jgi:hypothetical protein
LGEQHFLFVDIQISTHLMGPEDFMARPLGLEGLRHAKVAWEFSGLIVEEQLNETLQRQCNKQLI